MKGDFFMENRAKIRTSSERYRASPGRDNPKICRNERNVPIVIFGVPMLRRSPQMFIWYR